MWKNAIWLFVLALFILFAFLPSYTQLQDLRMKNVQYEQEIIRLKRERARLLREKKLLLEDPVYLEKVAREKMGLIKEGEMVYKITPAKKVAPKPTPKPGQP
jgi:cell division protein DivIC